MPEVVVLWVFHTWAFRWTHIHTQNEYTDNSLIPPPQFNTSIVQDNEDLATVEAQITVKSLSVLSPPPWL